MSGAGLFRCPHCQRILEVRPVLEHEAPPKPKPPAKTASGDPPCACSHPRSRHQDVPVGDGRTAAGAGVCLHGCGCPGFHARRRSARVPPSRANGVEIVDGAIAARPLLPPALPPNGAGLSAYASNLLAAVVMLGAPSSYAQIAVLAGVSRGSGSFKVAVAALKKTGCIEGGKLSAQATALGRSLFPDAPAMPTGAALIELWCDRVGDYAASLLQRFVVSYPSAVTRGELAAQTGYSSQSGSFKVALAKLRRLKLVDGDRASAALMRHVGTP